MSDPEILILPASWALSRVGDVAVINPKLVKTDLVDSLEVSFVPMPAVQAGTGEIDVTLTRQFGEVKAGYTAFREGDVLFAKITPCMENGKMAVVPKVCNGLAFGSTEFHVLRPHSGINARYIYHFVSSQRFRYDAEHNMTGAVGQRRVPTIYLSDHLIPIPPSDEQIRIVAKIEELFSELDNGVESLTTARKQLKVYRQAVLKHAFEGKLTADWRQTNRTRSESIQQRTEKLEHSRRKAWSDPKNTFRRGQYKPPAPYDDQDVPQVPNDWALVSMDALTFHTTSGSRDWSQYYDRGDATFIMAQNVRPGLYDPSFTQKIDPPINGPDSERTRAALDDLLVTIVGANTGNLCRFDIDSTSHYVCQSVALMRPVFPELARFLELYFQAETGGLRQYKRYIYGAGRPHLSFDQIKQTVAPLPDLQEAELIVERVSAIVSQIEALEDTFDDEVARADVLRQAILKKAFSGQLVAQDPNEEPASVLLQRIRAEKEDGDSGRKKNNRNGKKEAA